MSYFYADRPDGPSNPTRKHLFADCPSIAGIASPTSRSNAATRRYIEKLPLCRACEKAADTMGPHHE